MTTLTNIPRARVEYGPGAAQADEADMQTNRAIAVDEAQGFAASAVAAARRAAG